ALQYHSQSMLVFGDSPMLDVKELVWLTEEEIACSDPAVLNLSAAAGLRGTDKYDFAECIDRLDYYARGAAEYTRRRCGEFHSDPAYYHHSANKFRAVCMIQFLQKFGGVYYNQAKVPEDAPFYAEDTFIHGA